jgi:hypothetical protein
VDRRRVTLVLNGDHGPAEESRPEPNGASQQEEAPEGGRFGLEEAWEDVLRQQELLRKRAESKRQKAETQAERGLVALMSGGNTVYKPLEDLQPEDMPARIAANRLRVTWLKERRDEWLGRGEAPA